VRPNAVAFEFVHADVDVGTTSLALVAHPVLKPSVGYLCSRANTLRRFTALGIAHQDGDAIRSLEVLANVFVRRYRLVLDFIFEVAHSL
jgi:hypothetical protein